VFRTLRRPYLPLSYREIKEVLDEALRRAGITAVRQDLLAAYAHQLMSRYGFTFVDLRKSLGYSEVKHVRGLLADHLSWEADRKADRLGGPPP
jgi:hypothetical protein